LFELLKLKPMDCPKCKSNNRIKFGIVGGRQRFHCKDCKLSYTVSEIGKPMETRRMALKMYLEGIGLRAIGRLLGICHATVLNWIRKFGKEASDQVELMSRAPIIEMDELHTFVGVKKTTAGSGLQLTGSKKCL
jgi:transposase-like protein